MRTETDSNVQSFANSSVTLTVYVCFSPPQHGNPCGPDHVKSIVQFCPRTGQHTFHHISVYFDYPAQKFPVSSTDILEMAFHKPPQKEVQGHDNRSQGTGDWSILIFTS
jgi:hypothetical protein